MLRLGRGDRFYQERDGEKIGGEDNRADEKANNRRLSYG